MHLLIFLKNALGKVDVDNSILKKKTLFLEKINDK